MYCSHFGLHRPPFNNTPDPSFYYSTPDHEEALASLHYVTFHRKGFVLVTGEVGAGKTLVGRMFVRQIDREASTAVITHTQLSARQLLAAICSELELAVPPDATNLQLSEILQEYLLEQFAQDRFVVVLLDEAQNLPDESFEALRMLGNLEADDAKLLQVCILGQPELRERFRQENLKQLDQRLFRRFHLPALGEQQTAEYIRRRLAVAGCAKGDLFTPAAAELIYRASGGIPRVINQLCDNALLTAYGNGAHVVDRDIATQVIKQEMPAVRVPSVEPQESASEVSAAVAQLRPAQERAARHAQDGASSNHAVAVVEPDERPEVDAGVFSLLLDAENASSPSDPPPDEEYIQHSLERIYDEPPALTEVPMTPSPAPAGPAAESVASDETSRSLNEPAPSNSRYLQDALTSPARQWAAFKEESEAQQGALHRSIQMVFERCQEAERQIEEIAASTASCAEVEEVRRAHKAGVEELLTSIATTRREMQELVSRAEQQGSKLQAELAAVSGRSVTQEQAAELAQQQARQLAEMRREFEQYRGHMDTLVQMVGQKVDQTQATLSQWLEVQARSQIEMGERLDRRLTETQQQFDERMQHVAASADVESVRREHAEVQSRLRQELDTRVGQTREGLQERIGRVARGVRNLRAAHERLEGTIRQEVAAEVKEVRQDVGQRLAASESTLQKHVEATGQCIEDLKAQQEQRHGLLAHEVETLTAQQAGADQAIEHIERRTDTAEQRLDGLQTDLDNKAPNEAVAAVSEAVEQVRQENTSLEAEIQQAIASHQEQIDALNHDVESQIAHVQGALGSLKEQAATVEDIARLRHDHDATVEAMLGRLAVASEALASLRSDIESRIADVDNAGQESVATLSARLDEEDRQLRTTCQRLVRLHASVQEQLAALQAECATKAELENLREAQLTRSAEIIQQIQSSREAVQLLIDGVANRCRVTQEQLEVVAAHAQTDQQELTQLREVQARDVTELMRQLEDQRLAMQQQFDQAAADWTRTHEELQALQATAADAATLDDLQHRQSEFAEKTLQTFTAQREHLQSLVSSVNTRCDEIVARIDALPPDLATSRDIRLLQETTADQKNTLESAIQSVAEQGEQTEAALRALEHRAASAEEVRQIRQQQAQQLDQLVQRLDGQTVEHQHELDELNQQWLDLRDQITALATSTTPTAKFEAAEQSLTRDLGTLRERIDALAGRREKDVRVLVDVVQKLTDRVKTLEALDRPAPVKIELKTHEAEELARLTQAAQGEGATLQQTLSDAAATSMTLRDSSHQVEATIRTWVENAGAVQEQSEQLKSSAKLATDILQAMKKCHDALDAKLKSKRWQTEIARGEALTTRLEKAGSEARLLIEESKVLIERLHAGLDDGERARDEMERGEKVVRQLSQLLIEANRATRRFQAMVAGVASKTSSLLEVVATARQFDEEQRPIRPRHADTKSDKTVSDVNWPKYRTHVAAHAG